MTLRLSVIQKKPKCGKLWKAFETRRAGTCVTATRHIKAIIRLGRR